MMIAWMSLGPRPGSPACPSFGVGAEPDDEGAGVGAVVCVSVSFAPWRSPPSPRVTLVVVGGPASGIAGAPAPSPDGAPGAAPDGDFAASGAAPPHAPASAERTETSTRDAWIRMGRRVPPPRRQPVAMLR